MKNKLDTILLVDDDMISNYITEEMIRERGIAKTIKTATDGKQALDILQNIQQAQSAARDSILVLLDLNMPMMDGFEFMDELQALKLQQQVVVAILTSSNNYRDLSQASKYRFAAYLQKPISIEEVLAVVDTNFEATTKH